jgi:hypothetical protein
MRDAAHCPAAFGSIVASRFDAMHGRIDAATLVGSARAALRAWSPDLQVAAATLAVSRMR